MEWEGPVRTRYVVLDGETMFPLALPLEMTVKVPRLPPGFSPVILVLVEDTFRPVIQKSG